jgi:hypothetical protein
MKEPLEIVIQNNGLTLCHPADCEATLFLAREERDIGSRIAEYIAGANAHPTTLHLFISEDLLFFKAFDLPLDTADVAEAVGYQLEMVTPFADEATWHSFAVRKGEDAYHITLYATKSGYLDLYLQEIIEGGFQLSGLYPESQRYVNKLTRKCQWGLVLPGRYVKAFVFNGATMIDRQYCSDAPSFAEAQALCRTDMIFRLDHPAIRQEVAAAWPAKPYEGYLDACLLLAQRPHLKAYNMLPASYQRPDYLKLMIGALLLVNVLTMIFWGGEKVYNLRTASSQINREIAAIMPLVAEMKSLRGQEEDTVKALGEIEGIGKSFDLLGFMGRLTKAMPNDSYVDQLRYEQKGHILSIQGYTDDVSDLTAKLQEIGQAQLKSTSSRQNKTYFNVEITLP